MKKILFIAKVNPTIQELNEALETNFRVQIGSYNKPTVLRMMNMSRPDAVLVSLMGAVGMDVSLFSDIHEQFPNIPVLTIGDDNEIKRVARFLDMPQFENIKRPVANRDVVVRLCQKLRVDVNDAPKLAKGVLLTPEVADPRPTVMIVDDNAGMLRSIKTMLEDKYQIMLAPSGIKAMTMLGKKRPDVILLDYEMPMIDGKQTLEMIRADGEYADIPVVFLTGVNDREHIKSVISLKPAGYLLKPPVKETLVAAIDKALGARASGN